MRVEKNDQYNESTYFSNQTVDNSDNGQKSICN